MEEGKKEPFRGMSSGGVPPHSKRSTPPAWCSSCSRPLVQPSAGRSAPVLTPSEFTGKSQVGERVRSENTDRVHIMAMSTPQVRTESVERGSREINAGCTISVAAS